MITIRIVAESKDTVTIGRDDWETLQGELAELQDCTAVAERRDLPGSRQRLLSGSEPAAARIETSTPGVTAMFTIRPGPPNQVSVHPPKSQMRTGTDASITVRSP